MKFASICLFLLICGLAGAQETPRINLSYEDRPFSEVVEEIERQSGYSFFYAAEWLPKRTISGSFQDEPLQNVLDTLFRDTLLNFFVMDDGKVILTQNAIIVDNLPEDYFGSGETATEVPSGGIANPYFYSGATASGDEEIETVRIGKQERNSTRNRYTLSGTARNAETGQPIAEMAIVVEGRNTGTATNNEGYYQLELPAGVNILETSALGIESSRKKVIIYNDGNLDFDLQESFEVLDEVVVEGNQDRNVEQAATGVTLIEVEKIKNIPLVLGERDILKAALTLPGISTAGEGAAGYNVRGGRTDQNLILLDNGVIYNPTHFFGIFSALNPFTSGDVNIYKGSMPAEYGGRLSSVFDIRTRDANTEKFAGEASIGPVTGNLTLETPIIKDKAGILVGARGTYSGWILRSLDEEELSDSQASFYDIVGKYNHALNENNELRATAYYSRDAFSITSDSLYGYSNRLLALEWDHRFNNKNTGSVILSNSEYRFNIEYEGDSNDDFDLGYRINETEVKLKMKYLASEDHTFDYGIAAKYYGVEPGSKEPGGNDSEVLPIVLAEEQGLEAAAFISDSWEVTDRLLIDAGLRYSTYLALGPGTQRVYQENMPKNSGTLVESREFDDKEVIETYGGPEVRVSARYFLGEDFSVKASYNNAYQYIHTLSNNTTASPTDTWKLSDLNIKPQQASQVALGFYKNLAGNMYEISLEGYYKLSKNILDYKVGAQLLLNERLETEVLQGDGKAYGVEFLVRKNEGRLNGWLGYAYSRSFIQLDSDFPEERVNNGEYFPSNFDKPHDFSLVANYKFTRRFSVSANFVYQTGRPVTYPIGRYEFNNAEYVFYSDRNKFRIPDYYRLDLSFNMEGNHKIKKFAHSFWNFSIYNVLGRNNPFSVFFVTENGELKAYQSSIFAIPVPTITYNFKF